MLDFLARVLGTVLKYIYENIQHMFSEPKNISYYAIAIIIITIIAKLLIIPMTIQSQKQAQNMSRLKPKLDELEKKFGYDKQVLQKKQQELYKQEGASVMGCSSCGMMILQLIILFALYRVMREPAKYLFDNATSMDNIKTNFFWVGSLLKQDPLWFGLPLLTSISQFITSYFMMKTNPTQNAQMSSMNNMLLILPLVYYFVFRSMPAGLPLYWTVSSVIEIIFRVIMYVFFNPKGEKEIKK